MALNQIIQHETGAYSSYWRITNVSLDYKNAIAEITILGYVNEEARQNDRSPLDQRKNTVSNIDFLTYFSVPELDTNTNPVKQAYLYTKITPEFVGSVDV